MEAWRLAGEATRLRCRTPAHAQAARRLAAAAAPADARRRPPQRGPQAPAAGAGEALVVARGTEPGRLAGAVAARLRADAPAHVSAMGPSAAYVALRAIARAGEYLHRERPRHELAVTVQRSSAGKDSEGLEMFGMRLVVRLEAKADVEAKEREVRVAQATNIGHVASFLARALAESKGLPALRGMGPAAACQALKAAAIAQGYVQRELGGEMVFTPRVVRILTGPAGGSGAAGSTPPEDSSEQRKRSMEMVLRCRCIQTPSGKADAAKT